MDVPLFDRKYRIDEVCRDFEESRYEATPPSLLSFVDRVPTEDRDEILRELLAIEMELRLTGSGEIPVAEYLAKWPDLTDLIEQVYSEVIQLAADRELGEPEGVSRRTGENVRGLTPSGSPPDDSTQRTLGDFRIVREIGRGGMGRVFEAVQESLQRSVALKVLPSNSWMHEHGLERFQREARAIARLHHSHIVDVFGSGQQDGVSYFAMQLIDGVSLDKVISLNRQPEACATTSGRLTSPDDATVIVPPPTDAGSHASASFNRKPEACASGDGSLAVPVEAHASGLRLNEARVVARVGCEIAEALHYAHSQGVLHRDVKPSNILLDQQGTSWLTDFGLAKLVTGNHEGTLTEQGDVLGTLRYMAPEVLHGRGDERSDVCSLGLTLFELLSLRPAFDAEDRDQLLS